MSLKTRMKKINTRMEYLNSLINKEVGRPLPDSLVISDLKRRRLQLEDMLIQIRF